MGVFAWKGGQNECFGQKIDPFFMCDDYVRTFGVVVPEQPNVPAYETRFARVTPSLLSSETRSEGKAGALLVYIVRK